MIDLRAASAGLTGAWRLARLDPGGMRYFDATLDGFWRSFQAAIVAAPFYLLLLLLSTQDHPLSADPVRAALVEVIGYVINWTAFPLAAWYMARALHCTHRYLGFIVAYNWSTVLQVLAFIPIALLSVTDLVPDDLVIILAFLVTGATIYYRYFIARTALGIEALPALGFVALDFVIGLLLDKVEIALQLQ